jgi:hypothetical protein
VRRDCAQWQADVSTLLPTVVFGAKDAQGRDLFDVAVALDGDALVKKLDGKAVPVDPGPHTFTFSVAGRPPIAERVLVKEGEKARALVVTFAEGAAAVPAAAHSEEPARETPRGHSVAPWFLVGLGAAAVISGVVVIATTPGLPSNCDGAKLTCARTHGESDASLQADRDQAGRHDSQPVAGAVVLAGGVGVVGAGLLWHFLEPARAKHEALQLTPAVGSAFAGASLRGAF